MPSTLIQYTLQWIQHSANPLATEIADLVLQFLLQSNICKMSLFVGRTPFGKQSELLKRYFFLCLLTPVKAVLVSILAVYYNATLAFIL